MEKALDQQYITKAEFQDACDHAGWTRAASGGLIKGLLAYERGQHEIKITLNGVNPEPVNAYLHSLPNNLFDKYFIRIIYPDMSSYSFDHFFKYSPPAQRHGLFIMPAGFGPGSMPFRICRRNCL